MTHVIVYQMGKVASEAIVSALRDRGYDAHQCHFLGHDKLQSQFRRALNPNLSPHEETHAVQQFFRSVELFRLVTKYERKKFSPDQRLKIISLIRNPYHWYVSELIQNFPAYEANILRWLSLQGSDPPRETPLREKIVRLQHRISSLVCEVSPEIGSSLYFKQLAHLDKQGSPGIRVLTSHARRLSRPHIWFDNFMKSVFGVDIYDHVDDINSGYAVTKNTYADFLFVKYEMLGLAKPGFEAFLDIDDFSIEKKNVSENKYAAADVRSGVEAGTTSELLGKIGQTRYSRAFEYDRVLCDSQSGHQLLQVNG